jgi:hypothetical protein
MSELDYSDAVALDPDQLDVEEVRMPQLMADWSAKLGQAELTYQRAKASLACVEAELANRVREDPKRCGIYGRATADAVNSYVVLREEYVHAQAVVHEAQYNRDILKSAVEGLKCKRESLRDLVELARMRYFATPDTPRDLAASWAKFNVESTARLNASLKGKEV